MDDGLNLIRLMRECSDEDSARGYLEDLRWPDGPVCPHCGASGAYRLTARPLSRSPVRPGVLKCKTCRKQFTVRVGTIFEDSHIPLSTWVIAIHLMCSSKKGMSAHQLHRMLGITYKSAWFLAHRIRWAMAQPPLSDRLAGIVEADETYIGPRTPGKRGRGAAGKQIVVALVERDGRVRSFPVERVTERNLSAVMTEGIHPSARMMTDGLRTYRPIGKAFASHETVNHARGEYVRGDVHVNSAESFFALLKRGVHGTFHHVGRRHLHRYLAEFDFRWDRRYVSDGVRSMLAVKSTEGKRLTYRPLVGKA